MCSSLDGLHWRLYIIKNVITANIPFNTVIMLLPNLKCDIIDDLCKSLICKWWLHDRFIATSVKTLITNTWTECLSFCVHKCSCCYSHEQKHYTHIYVYVYDARQTDDPCTCRLVWGLSTFSRQLLHQEHEQRADLWLIAVQKGLVADLTFITNVLEKQFDVLKKTAAGQQAALELSQCSYWDIWVLH